VEDQRGIPFVGPAGTLLQRAVADAGISRGDVYVTNAVDHFRFTMRGKRRIHATPQVAHIRACKPWLDAEIADVAARLVVCLGATAAKALLGNKFRITRDRGVLIDKVADTPPQSLATAHPSSAADLLLGIFAASRAQEFAAVDPTLTTLLEHPPTSVEAFLRAEMADNATA